MMTNNNGSGGNGSGNGSNGAGGGPKRAAAALRRGGFTVVQGGSSSQQPPQAQQAQAQGNGLLPGVTPSPLTPKYDESEFLVGGKGTGPGDVERQWFRLHEGYIAMAKKVIDSKLFPYEAISDLYRHAVVRHFSFLAALERTAIDAGLIHQMNQIDEVVAHETRKIRFIRQIDAVAGAVSDIMAMPGGKRQAARLLRKIRQHINQMDQDFYRAYYEQMFQDRFGEYLTADSQLAGLVLMQTSGTEEEPESEIPSELLQQVNSAWEALSEDDDTN